MRPVLPLVLGVAACSSGLRVPPTGPPPATAAPVVVDYPPPPAQIERIDRDPGKPCEWVDGTYVWIGRHWEWTAGQWVIHRGACYYRAPKLVWAPSAQGPSTLYYFPAKWYEERAGVVAECEAPERCPLAPSKGD
jgi:hypothetical protein